MNISPFKATNVLDFVINFIARFQIKIHRWMQSEFYENQSIKSDSKHWKLS